MPLAVPFEFLVRRPVCCLALAATICCAVLPLPAQGPPTAKTTTTVTVDAAAKPPMPAPADAITDGTVTVNGARIAYHAVAGTITVGATDAQDAMLKADGQPATDSAEELPAKPQERPATARMYYTAYLRSDGDTANRPVTFIYNGGPVRRRCTCTWRRLAPGAWCCPTWSIRMADRTGW